MKSEGKPKLRKLHGSWTIEKAQDIEAWPHPDLEQELINIFVAEINAERFK